MRLLLDTHILLWAAAVPERLPSRAQALISDEANELLFSTASIWEVAIKHGLARLSFDLTPKEFYADLLDSSYLELPILAEHTFEVSGLPPLHRDPFDRLLVAQTLAEGDLLLLTADATLAKYPAPIMLV